MIKAIDTTDLVAEAQAGCRNALERLTEDVQRKMYPFLYKMTRDHHLAHDLLQETLLVMLQSLKKLERPEGFWGWIYTVARSRMYDHFRKKQRRGCANLLDLDVLEADGNNTVLRNLIDKERDEFLSIAVGNLRKRYRDVVYFRHFESRSYSEVASMSECTPQQARVRFFRAKQSLRKLLCEFECEFDV